MPTRSCCSGLENIFNFMARRVHFQGACPRAIIEAVTQKSHIKHELHDRANDPSRVSSIIQSACRINLV
jgi:Fe-S cluster biogenesis protein NfuA